MGVVCVYPYAVPEGKDGLNAVEMLQKRLESLGASRSGSFCVDCETYYSSNNIVPSRLVNIMHNSENPASCFALLDTGTCLVADNLFDLLMLKMNGIYSPKKTTKIESKGQRYQIEDFIVKVGSVSMGPVFKGILIEVEFGPCVIPANCFELIKEFVHGFMGQVSGPPQYMVSRMNEVHTPVDTVNQYLEQFSMYRRATSLTTAPGSR